MASVGYFGGFNCSGLGISGVRSQVEPVFIQHQTGTSGRIVDSDCRAYNRDAVAHHDYIKHPTRKEHRNS